MNLERTFKTIGALLEWKYLLIATGVMALIALLFLNWFAVVAWLVACGYAYAAWRLSRR